MKHTVLYIEDNPSNIKLVQRLMARRENIHLLVADNPQAGIALALAHRPALTLLDINMPGMNGYAVLEVFTAEESLKSMPVVAITASAMAADIAAGAAAGFTHYLTKPFDVAHFYAIVDRIVGPSQ